MNAGSLKERSDASATAHVSEGCSPIDATVRAFHCALVRAARAVLHRCEDHNVERVAIVARSVFTCQRIP